MERERGCGRQEPVPDWQVDKEEGGVVHGGGVKKERREREREGRTERNLKHQAIPVCGAVSIGPGYCRTRPSPVPCTASTGQTTHYSFDCELSALELFL